MAEISSKSSQQKYRVDITSDSGHEIIADEPKNVGGENLGMMPTELLIAALAACTSATLRMYADRKEWQLEEVNTKIKLIENKYDDARIIRTIGMTGDLDDKQRDRLLQIANKCPVHKMLKNGLDIETKAKNE
ncbi:MAG: OsmC family protein [Flavobacteriaceae bacterium]